MRIKSLTISSYKSFAQPTVINLSPSFNVFIGPNNCGKTNILDAVDFLFHPDLDPGRLHHHRSDMKMVINLDPDERKICKGSPGVQLVGKQYSVTCQNSQGATVTMRTARNFSQTVKRLLYEDFRNLEAIEKDYNLIARKYPAVFKKLTKLLADYFPEVGSVRRIADAMRESSSHDSEGHSITIERLGGGFRRVLVILLYALHPEYSVILIDEPEIHLHPGMVKKLRRFLQSSTTNQVIITTHSPVFVRSSNLHQVYRVLKDSQGSHVYYLGQSKKRINRKRLVQELNSDNVEMFFSDKVLLVEGVSDRILMRGLINRFYKGPDDIKVIYTHGKSNIDIFIDLMQIFHIPYLVLLDRDALHMVARDMGIHVSGRRYRKNKEQQRRLIKKLEQRNVIVLERGTIEHNYPRKYQNRDTKPLSALYAAANITQQEFRSSMMRNLRKVIELL